MEPTPDPSKPPLQPLLVEGAGGVVLNRRGRVLVIQHRNGTWVFPKGHLEAGEDHLAAALREVEEEAGVRAWSTAPPTTRTTSYLNPRNEQRFITWFLLLTDAEQPRMQEALFPRGSFLAAPEALRRLSYQEDRELLRAMLAAHAKLPRAAGDGPPAGGP